MDTKLTNNFVISPILLLYLQWWLPFFESCLMKVIQWPNELSYAVMALGTGQIK